MLGWLAVFYAVITQIAFAFQQSEYTWQRHTISELGVAGSPWQRGVAWGAFFPIAVLLFVHLGNAFWIDQISWVVWGCLNVIPLAYLGAALFPCDPGAPLLGSGRNRLHMGFAGLEYLIGPMGLFLLIGADSVIAFLLLIVIWGGSALMVMPGFQAWRGLIQRIVEYTLLGSVAYLTW